MVLDGYEEVRRAAVVQEKQALAESPKRCSSEFVGFCAALNDTIRQFRAHVMQQQIRV
jgi:hypothetical protein